jgi:hypothetical protein
MAKKSDNPFKMWGSWIGAILPLIYVFNRLTYECVGNIVWGMSCSRDYSVFFKHLISLFVPNPSLGESLGITIFFWVILIIVMAIFFLIGWGIHSLIRSLRR